MRYMRTGSLKRLFSFKRRTFEAEVGKQKSDSPEEDNHEVSNISPRTEAFKRPTWKCFSFDQIFVATNGFCSGFIQLSLYLYLYLYLSVCFLTSREFQQTEKECTFNSSFRQIFMCVYVPKPQIPFIKI